MSTQSQAVPVEAADGHQWQVHLWRATDAQTALLWLPALGVPALKYARWAQTMQDFGISVAIPDWRGLASSSQRPSRACDWGYRELVTLDIPASLIAVKARCPELPWAIGGHSLGGQLALLAAALSPTEFKAFLLIATGVPHHTLYPGIQRWLVAGFARVLGPMTRALGLFPGDRLNWAGREAGQLMRDWATTVRHGHYRFAGLGDDIETRMKSLQVPALGLRFDRDVLVPNDSMPALIGKLGPGAHTLEVFDQARLGDRADHFRWLRTPASISTVAAEWLKSQPR